VVREAYQDWVDKTGMEHFCSLRVPSTRGYDSRRGRYIDRRKKKVPVDVSELEILYTGDRKYSVYAGSGANRYHEVGKNAENVLLSTFPRSRVLERNAENWKMTEPFDIMKKNHKIEDKSLLDPRNWNYNLIVDCIKDQFALRDITNPSETVDFFDYDWQRTNEVMRQEKSHPSTDDLKMFLTSQRDPTHEFLAFLYDRNTYLSYLRIGRNY